ncbi:MAG: hypothetical protein AAF399_14060 [Bacteroidota bacterium]
MDNYVFLLGGGLTVLLAALILIQSKRTIFWTAFILVFVPIDYIKRYFFNIPTILRWLPVLTMVGFALLTFLVMTERKPQISRAMKRTYFGILAVSVISLIANGTAVPALVVAQRGFIMIFAFMTMLKAVYFIYDKHQLFGYVVYAGLASSAAAMFQRVFFVMLQGRSGDMVAGLFPVDGIYLYFQLAVIIIVLAYWLEGKEVITLLPNNVVLLIMMLSLAMGNNKAGFIFLGVVIAFVVQIAGFKTVMRNFGKVFIGFAMVGLVAMIFNSFYNTTYEDSNEESFSDAMGNPEYIRRYIFGGKLKHQKFAPSGQLLRGASVEFAYNLVADDPVAFFIGLGPGATQHSNMPGAMGWLEARYPGYTIGRLSLGMYIAEIGLLGLFMQFAFLFAIYYWKPKDPLADTKEFKLTRKAWVVMTLLYYTYENLYFEPVFALIIGVLVYPNILGARNLREAAQQELEASDTPEEAEAELVHI